MSTDPQIPSSNLETPSPAELRRKLEQVVAENRELRRHNRRLKRGSLRIGSLGLGIWLDLDRLREPDRPREMDELPEPTSEDTSPESETPRDEARDSKEDEAPEDTFPEAETPTDGDKNSKENETPAGKAREPEEKTGAESGRSWAGDLRKIFGTLIKRVPDAIVKVVVPLLTAIVLLLQTHYIRQQTEKFQVQLDNQEKQIANQIADTRFLKRRQLLLTIYEQQDCDRSEPRQGETCPPRAHIRLRGEAARDLIRLRSETMRASRCWASEADPGKRPIGCDGLNLSTADLKGADLFQAYLPDAVLFETDLAGAVLNSANLEKAFLRDANLRAAHLYNANLRGARLYSTDLTRAFLYRANLTNAEFNDREDDDAALLDEATLHGAVLEGAKKLTSDQLARTCGDSLTRIPQHLDRPAHWLDHPWKRGADAEDAGCPD